MYTRIGVTLRDVFMIEDGGMKNRAIFSILIIATFMPAAMLQAEDAPREKILDIALPDAEKAESYSHFFEIEKRAIADPVPKEYWRIRNGYILDCYDSRAQNPREPLAKLISICKREKYFISDEVISEYSDAAWLLGMELLKDQPSFEVDLADLDIVRGLPFAKNPEIELRLDLFRPKNRTDEPLPCIICIHGGGWRVHRRAWFNGHAAYFAKHGMIAISIDYRMFPGIQSPASCVEDCKAAVRWCRANAELWGIDPNRIGAVGGSAGAHLSAMLATTAGADKLEGEGGNAKYDSSIQAAVGYATPVFNPARMGESRRRRPWMSPEMAPLISPYFNVDKKSAPLFLIHGTNDGTVPIQNSYDIHAKYKEVGAHSELKVLEGKSHVFYTNAEAAGWALDFFKKQFMIK